MIEAESIGSDNPEGPPSADDADSDYGARKPRFKTTEFTFPHLEALQARQLSYNTREELEEFLSRFTNSEFGVKLNDMYRCNSKKQPSGRIVYAHYTCRFCTSRFSFSRHGDVLVVTNFRSTHYHQTEESKSKLEESVLQFLSENCEPTLSISAQVKSKALKEFKITPQQLKLIGEKFQSNKTNGFAYLKGALEAEGYRVLEDWLNQKGFAYPAVMVFASPNMIKNYQKYGDMVSFDITYNLLKNFSTEGRRFRVGVFCVYDSNIRILFAGLAIICRETIVELYRVFELFLRIHGKPPQSFITDEQQSFIGALEDLKQKEYWTGVHLFDPWHALKNIRKTLQGDEQRKGDIVRACKSLMMSRSAYECKQALETLSNDPINEAAINRFLDKSKNLCFVDIPRAFISIKRFSCEKINDLIKTQIPKEVTILQFMKKIRNLDEVLSEKSEKSYQLFKEPIEELFQDQRLHELRYSLERKPFSRFMENYCKCERIAKIVSQTAVERTSVTKFTIEDARTGEQFTVVDWNCSCDELEKTGIPCPHILVCAKARSNKKLVELVSLRWRKEVPAAKTARTTWIKAGSSGRSRRNNLRVQKKPAASECR